MCRKKGTEKGAFMKTFLALTFASAVTLMGCKRNNEPSNAASKPVAAANLPPQLRSPLPSALQMIAYVEKAASWAHCVTPSQKPMDVFAKDNFNRIWALLQSQWDEALSRHKTTSLAYVEWQSKTVDTVRDAMRASAEFTSQDTSGFDSDAHQKIRRCRNLGILFAVDFFAQSLRERLTNSCDAQFASRNGALHANLYCAKAVASEESVPSPTLESTSLKCSMQVTKSCQDSFDSKLKSLSDLCGKYTEPAFGELLAAQRRAACE